MSGQIECNQPYLGAGPVGINRHDMLVLLRPGLQLQLARDIVVDGYMLVIVIACQPLSRVRRLADRLVVRALNDVALGAEGLAIERLNLVRVIGSLVAGRLDPQMEAAKAHIHISGTVVVVLLHQGRAWVRR
jgi:hypothetical protein